MARQQRRAENAKRVILCAANKGGVGKSMVSRAYLDTARANGRVVAAYDMDSDNGSFARVYKERDALRGVQPVDLANRESDWTEAIYSDAHDVIYDIPGGQLRALFRRFNDQSAKFAEFVAAAQRELVVVSPIGIKKDSLITVQDAIAEFGDAMKAGSVHHVVVKNGFFGEEKDFVIFDGETRNGERRFGRVREEALEYNAEIVWIPRLSAFADALADEADLSFAEASKMGEHAALPRLDAYNVTAWLNDVREAFKGTWLDPWRTATEHVAVESASAASE